MDPDRAGRFDARTWRVGFHARHRTGVARANGSVTPEARLDQALKAEAGAYAAYTGLPDIGMAVIQGQSAERRWRAGYRL